VGFDGILVNPERPWESITEYDDDFYRISVIVNAFLVEQFRDKLWGFYDQIDFHRIRERAAQKDLEEDFDDEEFVTQVADQLAEEIEESEPEPVPDAPSQVRRVRMPQSSIKFNRLKRIFEKSFGCEVRHGTGSEVVVSRPTGKFCMGKHSKNPTYPCHYVDLMLKALGISRRQYVNALGQR
jgi:hypothetical protein